MIGETAPPSLFPLARIAEVARRALNLPSLRTPPPAPESALFKPALLAALLTGGVPVAICAQLPSLPLSLEVRGGIGIPVGDFADGNVSAESGFAWGAGAVFHATSAVGVYGEYSRASFGCGECGIFTLQDEAVDDGFDFGVQLSPGVAFSGLRPRLRAGLVAHQLRFSSAAGDASSDTGVGFAVGAGLGFSPLPSLTVIPAVHFRTYSADFPLGELEDRSVDVSHVTVDVGVAYRL